MTKPLPEAHEQLVRAAGKPLQHLRHGHFRGIPIWPLDLASIGAEQVSELGLGEVEAGRHLSGWTTAASGQAQLHLLQDRRAHGKGMRAEIIRKV